MKQFFVGDYLLVHPGATSAGDEHFFPWLKWVDHRLAQCPELPRWICHDK